jgi:hypothetical protein
MKRDRIIGIVLVIVCILLWFLIIPFQVASAKEAGYPKFVTLWIGLSSFALILRSLRKTPLGSQTEVQEKPSFPALGAIGGLLLLCVLSIDLLGFFIPSFLFLVISMFVQGVRDWRVHVAVPSTLLLFIYVLIEKLLKFPLPKGNIFG